MLVLLLAACADPISNQLFYEDGDFVQALPSVERLGAPQILLTAETDDASLQLEAIEQAALLANALDPLAHAGDTLRTTAPDVRSDVFRSWGAVPIVGDNGGRFWVNGEVGLSSDGVRTWSIDWAAESSGPYATLAVGQHTGTSTGIFAYNVDDDGTIRQVAGRYGLEPSGVPNLELGIGLGPNASELYWKVIGDTTIVWTGLFDVGALAPRPGVGMVVQDLDGGRGEAYTTTNDPVFITQCWDAAGTVVWSIDPDGTESGESDFCVMGALFE